MSYYCASALIGKRNVILIDWPQEHHLPAIDWNYFIVNWAVDDACAFVRPPLLCCVDCCLTPHAVVRFLHNNQLSGTLTSYIGQLTGLTIMYVVKLNDTFHLMDCAQDIVDQSIQRLNSDTNWAIDGANKLVRCRVGFDSHASLTPWQVLVHQSIQRHNSDTSCAIDKPQQLVSRDCPFMSVQTHVLLRRYLYTNRLTGTIPMMMMKWFFYVPYNGLVAVS
jgi:hypothetical protein